MDNQSTITRNSTQRGERKGESNGEEHRKDRWDRRRHTDIPCIQKENYVVNGCRRYIGKHTHTHR